MLEYATIYSLKSLCPPAQHAACSGDDNVMLRCLKGALPALGACGWCCSAVTSECWFRMMLKMDPPEMYGMTIHNCSLCTKEQYRGMTLGCRISAMICVSLLIVSCEAAARYRTPCSVKHPRLTTLVSTAALAWG